MVLAKMESGEIDPIEVTINIMYISISMFKGPRHQNEQINSHKDVRRSKRTGKEEERRMLLR